MELPDNGVMAPDVLHPMPDSGPLILGGAFDPGENLRPAAGMYSLYVDTYRSTSLAGSTPPLHSHSFYELIYCRSAAQVEYQLGTQRYELQQGDLLFIAPGVPHRPILPKFLEEPYTRDVVRVNGEFLEKLRRSLMPEAEPYAGKTGLYRVDGILGANIGELFRKGILEAEAREVGWEAAVVANFIFIMTQLRRAVAQKKPQKPERADLLAQILTYIEFHWAEKITMADVAKHFFISESTITQIFRRKMGTSFYRCVTQRRLSAAQSLIDQGLSLVAVAEQSGFADYSSFFRAFKQEYGVSPRQYRKTHQNTDSGRP